jgi:hypothetical protein
MKSFLPRGVVNNKIVGAGSPRKSRAESLDTKTTDDPKPALSFRTQIEMTSNDTKRAGYRWDANYTTRGLES